MPNFERGVPQQESSLRSKEVRDNFNALDDRTGKLTPKVLETMSTIINIGAGLVYFGDNKFIDFPGGNINLADPVNGVDQFISPGFWREVLVYISSTSTKASLTTNFLTPNSNLKFIASDARSGSIGNSISIEFQETTDPEISVDVAGFEITFSIPDSGTITANDFKDWFDDPVLNPASGDLKGLIGEVNSSFVGNDGTGIINTTFPKTRLVGGFDIDTTQGATLGIVSGPEKENLAAIARPDFSRADFPNFPTDVVPICVVVVQNNGNTAEPGSIESFTQSSVFDMRGYLNLTRSELALNQHRALSVNEAHTGKITADGLSGGCITNIKHKVLKGRILGTPLDTTITLSTSNANIIKGGSSTPFLIRFIKAGDVDTPIEDSDLGLEVDPDAIIETRYVIDVPSNNTLELDKALDNPSEYANGYVSRGEITEDKLAFEPTKNADFISHIENDTDAHGIDIPEIFYKTGDIANITNRDHNDLQNTGSSSAHTQYPLKANTETISGLWTYSSNIEAIGTPDIGTFISRFGEGFFQDLDISNNINIVGNIDTSGNIVMDASKTVDGVDVSEHDHSGIGEGGTIIAASISGLGSFIETEVQSQSYTIAGNWIFNGNVTINGSSGTKLLAANFPDIGEPLNPFKDIYANSLDITGNITVGGTVDGVDVADLENDFNTIVSSRPTIGDGSSLSYVVGNLSDWAGSPPTNVKDAIDRIAAAVVAGVHGAIA